MKRPKLKRASKRLTCSKRYKIQKKVREHNRKLKKDAKKKGTKRVKKDPGVPNNAPFKEEILREAESRKLKLEELKEKKKLAKQKERAKKRKREAEKNDPESSAKKAKKEKPAQQPVKAANGNDKNAQNYAQAVELNKVIDASDVIAVVLDARDPLGCRCPQLEEKVLKHEGNKKLVFVLNKIDLVPKENVEKWLEYLQEFPVIAFKASTQIQEKTVQEKKRKKANGAIDLSKGVACHGSGSLLQLFEDYCQTQKEGNQLKVGIVGFPNVGKSSLINSMKGIRACNVGVERGTTKCVQEVHINKFIKMIDSPSIIAAPSSSAVALALRSLPETEKERNPQDAVRALHKHSDKQQIMLQYNVPDFRNALEFLTFLAKKRGYLQKGGIPDTEKAAAIFLNDWTGAKMSYHSKPPEEHELPPYLSDSMVAEMQVMWSVDKLQQANVKTIAGLKFPNIASSILFQSKGPTPGLVNERELSLALEPEEAVAEDDSEEEEPELVPIVPETQKGLQEHKQKRPLKAETSAEPPKKANAGVPPKLQIRQMPVSIDFSSAEQDDDAYDFNADFN